MEEKLVPAAGFELKTVDISGFKRSLSPSAVVFNIGAGWRMLKARREAVKIVNNRAALVGNMGVGRPLLQGTPEECRAHAHETKKAGVNVVAPGCGLAARVPKANIEAMVKAIKG